MKQNKFCFLKKKDTPKIQPTGQHIFVQKILTFL